MRLRDRLGELFSDSAFTELYARRGRPGFSPASLALVSVLQFVENLTDRQAADAVRGRIDWKYALGLGLADPGFDASVLSEFRSRLARDPECGRILEAVLERAAAEGLLGAGGQARTDSTAVLGRIRELHTLELVVETLRAALEVLTVAAPQWLRAFAPAEWSERYAQRASNYRLPKDERERGAYAAVVGGDGYLLLDAIRDGRAPDWLGQVPAVQVLRTVWLQRFYRDDAGARLRGKDESPPGAISILSPYDVQARYSVKHGVSWCGYKVHLTERCEPGAPHLIVHVDTTPATVTDVDRLPAVHSGLESKGLLPDTHVVDAGYISVDHIIDSRERYGIELIGPLPPDSGWQVRAPGAFDISQFTIDWENRQVTCPQGKTSRNWQERASRTGLPQVHVTFRRPDCFPCPDRERCTRAGTGVRALTFKTREQFEEQQRVRREQQTAEWKSRYAIRAGVEGTIAQGAQRSGLHHARYRGLDKVHLQHVLTATALNLVRLDAWLTGTPLGETRKTHFAQLRPARM